MPSASTTGVATTPSRRGGRNISAAAARNVARRGRSTGGSMRTAARIAPRCRRRRASRARCCRRTPRAADAKRRSGYYSSLSSPRNASHIRYHGTIHKPRRRVIVHRARTHRTHRLHRISCDPHHGALVPCRQLPGHGNGATVDANQSDARRAPGRTRPHRRTVSAKSRAYIRPAVEACAPPRTAPSHSRSPSPAKALVPVPRPTRIRQITPGVG